MFPQAAIKPHTLHRNEAHRIVNRAVQKCTCAGASLRNRKRLPLCCINLDTATEEPYECGSFLVQRKPCGNRRGPLRNTPGRRLCSKSCFFYLLLLREMSIMVDAADRTECE